jgi:hypothetical protein
MVQEYTKRGNHGGREIRVISGGCVKDNILLVDSQALPARPSGNLRCMCDVE